MADNKKISELNQIQSLNDADEFVVVDKSTTAGTDAGSGGKTTRATLSQLKEAVSESKRSKRCNVAQGLTPQGYTKRFRWIKRTTRTTRTIGNPVRKELQVRKVRKVHREVQVLFQNIWKNVILSQAMIAMVYFCQW